MTSTDQSRAHYALAHYADLIDAAHDGTILPALDWVHNEMTRISAVETVLRQETQLREIASGDRDAHWIDDRGEWVLIQELGLRGVLHWWERRQMPVTGEREEAA